MTTWEKVKEYVTPTKIAAFAFWLFLLGLTVYSFHH